MELLGICLWGGVVLLSWEGWGTILCALLRVDVEQSPVGFRCAWGMAVVVVLGGLLMLFHAATAGGLMALSLLGAAAAVAGGAIRLRRWAFRTRGIRGDIRAARPWWLLAYLVPAALLAPAFVAAGFWPFYWNECDDVQAYLPLTQRLLQTGTLIEPMSIRRIVAFGGHTLLQAQALCAAPPDALFLVEFGLCPLVLMLLMIGLIRPRTPGMHILAAGAAATLRLFAVPWVNSHSILCGAVAFLGIVAALPILRRDSRRWGGCILLGITAAAAITLRAPYIVLVVAALATSLLLDCLANPRRWIASALAYAATGLVALLCLAPWAIVLYLSSHTPIFPFIHGNYINLGLNGSAAVGAMLRRLGSGIVAPIAWPLLLPLLLCLRKRGWQIIPIGVGAIAMLAALLDQLYPASDANIYRYAFGGLYAAAIAATGLTLRDFAGRLVAPLVLGGFFLCGLASWRIGSPCHLHHTIANEIAPDILALREGIGPRLLFLQRFGVANGVPDSLEFPDFVQAQRQAQAAIPPGARVLVAIDAPWALDYRRNDLVLLDEPGVCSPAPGMPMFQGPDALKRYLQSQGIDFLLLVDFDHAAGNDYRRNWQSGLYLSTPQVAPLAPYYLDAMHNLDALADTQLPIARFKNLRVIELR